MMNINLARKLLGLLLLSVGMSPAFAWKLAQEPIDLNAPKKEQQEPKESLETKEDFKVSSVTNDLKKPDEMSKVDEKNLVFEKRSSKLSEDEQAIHDYSEALEAIKVGLDDKAETLLIQSLKKYPLHIYSRLELAKVYIKHQRDLEAQCLLEEGLTLSENHPEFLKLLMAIFEKREEIDLALACLKRIPIEKQDSDVVAFAAYLYQSKGLYAKARNQYQRLLQVDPDNPRWALGVAIAFESEGKKRAALSSFEKLYKEGGLEPSMMVYVEERIAALKAK